MMISTMVGRWISGFYKTYNYTQYVSGLVVEQINHMIAIEASDIKNDGELKWYSMDSLSDLTSTPNDLISEYPNYIRYNKLFKEMGLQYDADIIKDELSGNTGRWGE